MPYFLYKPLNVANLGGIFPKPKGNVDLGLCEREGYYLGYAKTPEDIEDIKDYVVCFIDDETAEGFRLLGVDRVPERTEEEPLRRDSFRDLTDEERRKQKKAEQLVGKLKFRYRVDYEFQDLPDSVSDNAKLIRFLFYIISILFNVLPDDLKQQLKQNIPYLDSVMVPSNFESFQLSEDDLQRILNRQFRILNLVQDYKNQCKE